MENDHFFSRLLGRLSTQRLGDRLEMFTCKDPTLSPETLHNVQQHVAFKWSDFGTDQTLTAVPILVNQIAQEKPKPGTRLIITDLNDPEVWVGDKQRELISQLSQLIFPFEEVRPFNVYVTINGIRIDLGTISTNLRDVSLSSYHFSFGLDANQVPDQEHPLRLSISGKIRLSRLKGNEKDDVYNELLLKDLGKEFFAYLQNPSNKNKIADIKYIGTGGWFISFERHFDVSKFPGAALVSKGYANPGCFFGEIDEFMLRGINSDSDTLEDIYNKSADYKKFVSNNAGIRVYRDGFGIRPYGLNANDWLGLSMEQTSGRSFYSMRPKNVIGYVSLSAKQNGQLKEKTDREGFVNSPYQQNFLQIVLFVKDEINRFLFSLRRSFVEYKKNDADNKSTLFSGNTLDSMRNVAIASESVEQKFIKLDSGLEKLVVSVQSVVTKAQETPLLATDEERTLTPILASAGEKLAEAHNLVEDFRVLVSKLKQFETKADSLESQIEILQDQVSQFSELAGLGLTAEALSHEINTIVDRVAEQTKNINENIKRKKITDPQLIAYFEYVYSAISGLRKQLSHLAPSLRYVRESKDIISVRDFFSNQKEFYETGRFNQSKIKIILEKPFDNFSISMNKGKLTQIIDNLMLNSEYWLRESVRRQEIKRPQITVKSECPLISLYDNGIGLEPAIESSLFQPFVTTKPKNIGRGLGLFIVQELLDSSGCSISLLPDRNEFGRRFIFQIDFGGTVHGN